jgi:hypothetical protein
VESLPQYEPSTSWRVTWLRLMSEHDRARRERRRSSFRCARIETMNRPWGSPLGVLAVTFRFQEPSSLPPAPGSNSPEEREAFASLVPFEFSDATNSDCRG